MTEPSPHHADLPLPDYDHLPLPSLLQRVCTLDADGVRELTIRAKGESDGPADQVSLGLRFDRTAPIIGARNLEQLEANLGASGWALEPEQVAKLDEASAVTPPYPYDA